MIITVCTDDGTIADTLENVTIPQTVVGRAALLLDIIELLELAARLEESEQQ